MLRHDEREKERGGEAPMEIDSPPPLWLKSPTSPSSIFQSPLNNNTPPVTVKESSNDTKFQINTMNPNNSNNTINAGNTSNSVNDLNDNSDENSPLNRTPPSIRSTSVRPQTSPLIGSNGKSPLRSCHTNSDAVLHLRRLATATYHVNSSPPNRSPTVLMMMNRRGGGGGSTPQSQKKRKSSTDPTKVAAAAALVNSSSTAWHLHFPIILMNYFQLIFNTFIGIGILYLAFSATRTILHDAQFKVDERLQVMISEIAHCSRQYADNKCSPEQRVPAMEKVCMEWETCMSRDPSATSRARLHAETIAEILNGFFGAISTKTYIFMISGTVLVLVLFNAAFYFGRHSQPPAANPMASNFSQSIGSRSHHHLSYSAPPSPLMIK